MRLSFLLIATAAAGVWSMAEAQGCYNNTKEIFEAQVGLVLSGLKMKEFIVCPNTYIKVGAPNQYLTDFEYGDYPLLPIGPDVTFKCGLSGKSENNCTLDGSFLHFLSLPFLNVPKVIEIPSINTDNLYVSGFTFTGNGTRLAPEDSFSVTINAPGKNQTFNDIIWKDAKFQTYFQAMELDVVPDAALPDSSIEVTLQNSKFHNIEYGSAVLNVVKQSLTVRNTSFDEVKAYDCGCTPSLVSAFTGFSNSNKWTSTNDTYIDLIDNCFQGVEASRALITTYSYDTAKVILNKENNYVKDVTLLEDDKPCKKGISIFKDGELERKCKKFADAKRCPLSDTNKGSKSGKSASNKGGKSGKSASYKGSKSDADKKSRI